MNEQSEIPEDVLEALEAVRASGVTNMMDRRAVLFEMEMQWNFGAATWLAQNRARYIDALNAMGARRRRTD